MYNVYFYFSSSVVAYTGTVGLWDQISFYYKLQKTCEFFFRLYFFFRRSGKELKIPSRYCFCKEK